MAKLLHKSIGLSNGSAADPDSYEAYQRHFKEVGGFGCVGGWGVWVLGGVRARVCLCVRFVLGKECLWLWHPFKTTQVALSSLSNSHPPPSLNPLNPPTASPPITTGPCPRPPRLPGAGSLPPPRLRRRGRAGRLHHGALLHGGDVAGRHQPGDARDDCDCDEQDRGKVQQVVGVSWGD